MALEIWTAGVGIPGHTARMARRAEDEGWDGIGLVDSQNLAGVSYTWRFTGQAQRMTMLTEGECEPIRAGTQQEFITEHYWGYSRLRGGGTLEYRVEHPKWCLRAARESHLECDTAGLYGEKFEQFLSVPASAFVADGSPVTVHRGVRIA